MLDITACFPLSIFVQCKAPFDYLYTYRQLDGTVSDVAVEEPVVLLKRAPWFVDYMRVSMGGILPFLARLQLCWRLHIETSVV